MVFLPRCNNCQNIAVGIAKGADPDQTAPQKQPDLGLHCLLETSIPMHWNIMVIRPTLGTQGNFYLSTSIK